MRLPLYAALACHRALKPGPTRGVVCCAEPSGYHVPVMLDEVLSWMVTDPAGTYADGTLGGAHLVGQIAQIDLVHRAVRDRRRGRRYATVHDDIRAASGSISFTCTIVQYRTST